MCRRLMTTGGWVASKKVYRLSSWQRSARFARIFALALFAISALENFTGERVRRLRDTLDITFFKGARSRLVHARWEPTTLKKSRSPFSNYPPCLRAGHNLFHSSVLRTPKGLSLFAPQCAVSPSDLAP